MEYEYSEWWKTKIIKKIYEKTEIFLLHFQYDSNAGTISMYNQFVMKNFEFKEIYFSKTTLETFWINTFLMDILKESFSWKNWKNNEIILNETHLDYDYDYDYEKLYRRYFAEDWKFLLS